MKIKHIRMLATEGLLDNAGSTFITNALETKERRPSRRRSCGQRRGTAIGPYSYLDVAAR